SSAGDGSASYSVAQNTGGTARTGTFTPAGRTITVNQAGAASCAFPVAPNAQAFSAAGGTGGISVTSPPCACSGSATPSASWITIDSGSTGSGNGTVSYRVATNAANSTRNSTITVAGQVFTVSQAAAGCTYQILPSSRTISQLSTTGSIAVTAPSGCTWTA